MQPLNELRLQGLTVMVNTYKRPDMLQSKSLHFPILSFSDFIINLEGAIEHYNKCPVVSSIRVVWCEKGNPPDMKNW